MQPWGCYRAKGLGAGLAGPVLLLWSSVPSGSCTWSVSHGDYHIQIIGSGIFTLDKVLLCPNCLFSALFKLGAG